MSWYSLFPDAPAAVGSILPLLCLELGRLATRLSYPAAAGCVTERPLIRFFSVYASILMASRIEGVAQRSRAHKHA